MTGKGKFFFKRIKNSKSLIAVSSLLTGNFTSVLIPVLISPLLTRLFTEADFGVLTLFVSIVSISLSVSTGRLDYAIIEAKSKSIASHLFQASLLFTLGSTLVCLCIGIIVIPLIDGYDTTDLYIGLVLLTLSILIGSTTQSLRYVLNRYEQYKNLAIIKVFRSVNTSVIQVSGGYIQPNSFTLIIGKLFGDIVALAVSIWFTAKQNLIEFTFRKYKLRYVLSKYSRYYKLNTIHALINTSSAHLLPVIFIILFTIQETGYYGLSFRVCVLPVTIISQAIFQIFSREFAKRLEKNEKTVHLFKKVLLGLISVSIIPFSGLTIFGPEIFGLIFGNNWMESGRYAQILAPYMFMVFIVSPFTFVPIRLNKHYKSFLIELINSVARFLALIIGAQFGVAIALALYAFIGLVMQVYLLSWIYKLIRRENAFLVSN